MKEGSVPVHMTVWNDEADEKSGQLTNRKCFEQKKSPDSFLNQGLCSRPRRESNPCRRRERPMS